MAYTSEIEKRIKELEDSLSKAQYNKATEHAFGVVKAQIAKLREKIEKRAASSTGGKGFDVKKSGDATVVLVGLPSVGKSTLLNKLTGAKSEVAAYAFTTLTVIPGVLNYREAKIQILDVPGIVEGAASGRGRGKEVLAVARTCDLLLLLIEANAFEQYNVLVKELYEVNIRINQLPVAIKLVKKERGGIKLHLTTPLTKVSKETLIAVAKELKLINAEIIIREDITIERFIDGIEGNRIYLPAIVVASKSDIASKQELKKLQDEVPVDLLVAAEQNKGIEELKESLFLKLRFIRLYLKEIHKEPDLKEPMILLEGSTLRTVGDRIHRDFTKKFKFAKIWGSSAKFPGQIFSKLEKRLADKDVIEFHLR